MLGAFLPDTPSVRDVDIVRRNSATLRRAGYGYVAQRIEQELEADPDVGRTFKWVRESFPSRARTTELRRVQAVRRAAQAEGFVPTPGMQEHFLFRLPGACVHRIKSLKLPFLSSYSRIIIIIG